MKNVRSQEQIKKIENSFYSVFKNKDPFGEMFRKEIDERIVLCPTNGYYLSKNQFDALIKVVEFIGEEEIIISIVENESNSFLDSEYWICKNTMNYNQYLQLPVYLENSIYSQTGKWGILISHEEHAVIGGDTTFINKFKEFYTQWNEGLDNFINMWQYNKDNFNSDIEWLSKFLSHMSL